MKKTIILYGLLLGGLIAMLKYFEYRYMIRSLSSEMYIGFIALLFTAVGIWVGSRIMRRNQLTPESPPVPIEPQPTIDEKQIEQLGISKREYEVLVLIAEGLSNQEVAEKLFVSVSTVKTHTSNLFVKLDVKRRTQAVVKAKELGIIQ